MTQFHEKRMEMFDKKALGFLVLCFAFIFGWNKYLAHKYPQKAETVKSKTSASAPTSAEQAVVKVDQRSRLEEKSDSSIEPESFIEISNEHFQLRISNYGMGIRDLKLKKFFDFDNRQISLGLSDHEGLFESRDILTQKPIIFELKSENSDKVVGVATVQGAKVVRTYEFDPKSYSARSSVVIEQGQDLLKKGIGFVLPEKITAKKSTSFLFPSYEHQDFFVGGFDKSEAINFSNATEILNKSFQVGRLVAVVNQYFGTGLLDKSELLPSIQLWSDPTQSAARAEATYRSDQVPSMIQLSQILFFGPKALDTLSNIDPEMIQIRNFGMLAFIARPMLQFMKVCFSFIENWGLAIIFLTLFVRILVLPFNLMSAKSMRAMQKIQPQMAELRERYKEEPVKMQQEVMRLMKENNANPLGGCLPMLLQIPIFFALYQVIGSSVELYRSPFFGWIQDLSQHDRFYILPLLMGVTMYIQQKMTPTNMDPTQAKILAFLPLIFTIFMVNLPSGLTLYMFVSAVFGIVQQWYILRGTKPA